MLPIQMTITSKPQKKMFIWLGIWFLSIVLLVAVVMFFDPTPNRP
jgi:uncharacterized protein involved in outer membrane biogenesis